MKRARLIMLLFSMQFITISTNAAIIASGTCGKDDPESVQWELTDDGVLTVSGKGPMEDFEVSNVSWQKHRSLIKKVTIEDGVTSIGKLAFEGCSELKEVIFPDVLQSIGERAFQNCLELKEVIFPDALQSIGKLAFSNCLTLSRLYIPNSVTFIGWIALPNVHITVGEDNPNYCAIQDILYTRDLDTLIFCAKQREGTVEIPNTVRHIADRAFYGCRKIKDVSIPNSVITIGQEAFGECKSLHAIMIPDSVVSMGWNSLSGCTNLTKISIGKSLTSIGADYKKNITSCPKLIQISVSEENPYFTVIDGILYTKEIDTLICCRKDIMEVTIPNTVKVIIWGAFEYCKNISSISIPEGVEQIPGYTFYGCKNLKSVYFPKSLVGIDPEAFLGCNNLKKIYLQSPNPNGDILLCVKTGQCTFFVPKGSGKIYENWRDPTIHSQEPFKFDKIVEYDFK
ncbi:MAG: leucine-rich repeat domain-containing protein [Bacteroidaceae bacterium]|nr:leucine-rich repeat domain-containing protein [Bacteroidaceae bacterium]